MFMICVNVTLYDLKAQLNQINSRLNHEGTIKWSMLLVSVDRLGWAHSIHLYENLERRRRENHVLHI